MTPSEKPQELGSSPASVVSGTTGDERRMSPGSFASSPPPYKTLGVERRHYELWEIKQDEGWKAECSREVGSRLH